MNKKEEIEELIKEADEIKQESKRVVAELKKLFFLDMIDNKGNFK